MLRTVESLKGYAIRATDGELGHVEELYFDDQKWGVRYLIVKPGSWFSRQRVLISPYSVTSINDDDETVHVNLTQKQVEGSPDIDTHQPVSRQMEQEHASYFGYGAYWSGPYLWGVGGYPVMSVPAEDGVAPVASSVSSKTEDTVSDEDVHLRSADSIEDYAIEGIDGDIGHVQDILFDDKAWVVRYLVIDTRNWWPGGKKVVIANQWIDEISWVESAVRIRLTRKQIKNSPEYDENIAMDRDFERRLHDHYGRTGYWDS